MLPESGNFQVLLSMTGDDEHVAQENHHCCTGPFIDACTGSCFCRIRLQGGRDFFRHRTGLLSGGSGKKDHGDDDRQDQCPGRH